MNETMTGKAATAVLQAAFLLLKKRTVKASHVPSVPQAPVDRQYDSTGERKACFVPHNKHVVLTGTSVCGFEWELISNEGEA